MAIYSLMIFYSFKGRSRIVYISTYEVTSHKGEGMGRKIVENLIVLSDAIFLSLEKI